MKKTKLSKKENELLDRRKSFQDLIPITKIKNRLYLTKNNEYLSVFALGQKSIDLMSEDEVYEFTRTLERTFETLGIKKIQFLLLPVPFDLDPYLGQRRKRLKELKEEESEIKSKLLGKLNTQHKSFLEDDLSQNLILQKYIDDQTYFVTRSMQSGRIANKHAYVICDIKDSYNEVAASEAAKSIESALKEISSESHRCTESEMEKILIEIYNPLRPEIYINS